MFEYKTLYEISSSLNSKTDIHDLVILAIDKVIENTKANRGLLLIRAKGGELKFECARQRDKKDIEKPDSEISKTIIRKVLDSGESLVLENALQNSDIDVSASMRSLNLMSIACAPLKTDDETFGVIYIDNNDVTALFDENTKKLLDELSKMISVPVKNSIDRSILLEQQRRLKAELQEEKGYGQIIGSSPGMVKVFDLIEQIADTPATILITGETGTGKELIAWELHTRSARRDHELVTLNCSAIPENLLEAELFGHEKGAFTGADKTKPGWFEVADKGTIFLDEIGEMSLDAQVRLLRLVQFGEYTPVGSKETKKVDVRILAATNRDLEEMVREGTFRKDLFYRINVIELKLPPLRERGADITQIAEYFLERLARQAKKNMQGFSPEAIEQLGKYDFPGNIRELENIVQRAVFLSRSETISANDLNLVLGSRPPQHFPIEETNFKTAKSKLIEDFEREFLTARLQESHGNITKAAEKAGIYKKNFIDKMKQYGMRGEDFK